MPSEEAITELIEDKFVTVKEELEEIIDEVKNDVDEKSVEISNNKRSQEQSFEQINNAMEKLRKDLKQLGKFSSKTRITYVCCLLMLCPLSDLVVDTSPKIPKMKNEKCMCCTFEDLTTIVAIFLISCFTYLEKVKENFENSPIRFYF